MTVPRVVVRCPVCQAVAPAQRLAVDARGAEITCGECGVATRFPPYEASPAVEPAPAAAAPAAPTPSTAPAPPATAAPDGPGPDDPRLLLVYEVEGLPEQLIERYRAAVRAGDDEEAHVAVVRAATASGDLHLVGSLYRRRAERLPGDAVSAAMRERVLAAALTTLKPSDGEEIQQKVRGMGAVAAVFMLVLALLILGGVVLRTGCPFSPLSP